jgi:MFS family permease
VTPRRADTIGPLAGFFALGLFWGGFASLQPALGVDLRIDDSAMGMARLVGTGGAVVGLTIGGMLADRLGRRAIAWTTFAFALGALATGIAPSYVVLLGGMVFAGLASGSLDVAMNAEVSALDAAGRNVISLAHALYSVGILTGGAGVGLARDLDASRAAIGAGLALLMVAAVPLNLRDPLRERRSGSRGDAELTTAAIGAEAAARSSAGPSASTRLLALLGIMGALAFVVEASIGSWSAVHIERTLDASPAISGWGPGIVGLSMVAGRLAFQRVGARLDQLVALGVGAFVSAVGLVIAATAHAPAVAILGFGIAGLGLSVVGPIVYGLAGRAGGQARRGRAIAIVTTISYVGLLRGPAMIGIVAVATSLPAALLWLPPFSLACAALAIVVARSRRGAVV